MKGGSSLTVSSRRVRADRGFALVSALLISVLFFGLIELTLRDTTERVRAAHRYRARIASEILADNGVDLAAAGMILGAPKEETRENRDGTMTGSFQLLPGNRFEIVGEGESAGVTRVRTRVVLRGRITGNSIVVEESETK
jgi:hypothetical protein